MLVMYNYYVDQARASEHEALIPQSRASPVEGRGTAAAVKTASWNTSDVMGGLALRIFIALALCSPALVGMLGSVVTGGRSRKVGGVVGGEEEVGIGGGRATGFLQLLPGAQVQRRSPYKRFTEGEMKTMLEERLKSEALDKMKDEDEQAKFERRTRSALSPSQDQVLSDPTEPSLTSLVKDCDPIVDPRYHGNGYKKSSLPPVDAAYFFQGSPLPWYQSQSPQAAGASDCSGRGNVTVQPQLQKGLAVPRNRSAVPGDAKETEPPYPAASTKGKTASLSLKPMLDASRSLLKRLSLGLRKDGASGESSSNQAAGHQASPVFVVNADGMKYKSYRKGRATAN